MGDTIHVTASLRIEAAPDLVRAQYRDIDHHIRNDVHPDIKYTWEPSASGERKIRTVFRILGIPQFDVSLLEDAPDGSFIIRYLEGTNADMVLVHEFVPLDGGKATEVRLKADAPSTLGRKILGPLFVVGARQVMKKALFEDKRDIEKGFAPGKAAGNVARALERVGKARSKGDSAARAILEASCFVTAVDGTVDEAETDVVRSIAAALGVDAEWVENRRQVIVRWASSDDAASRAGEIGAQLKTRGVAEEGIVAAATAALVSQGMSLGELEALRALATGAGLAEDAMGPIVESVDAALTNP
jgi:DnaJ-domain-containing protein 1